MRGTLVSLVAVGVLLSASHAAAAKLDVTPSISLDQTYDSNVFNTNGNEKEDFILRATPAVTLSWRMPETTLSLRASLTSDRYYKYTELNTTNSAISLAIGATPIRLTPRFSISPAGHFVQAQDSYRRNQLVPSGDPLIPASTASETATRKSRDYGAALRMNYLVTPSTDVSVGGGFSKRQFLDNGTAGDVDSRVVTGDTTLTHRFSPLFHSGFFFNTAYNTFENGRNSRILSGGLTGSYQFSPAVLLSVRGGGSRAQESDPVLASDRTTWSPATSFSLTHSDNTFRASLSGSFEHAGGGSFGVTTQRQTVLLSLSDQFASRWWADLTGSYQVNRSLDETVSEDLSSATGTAGIRYQHRDWLSLNLSGTAFRQWSNGTVGTDLKRYSAFLGLTLGYTYNIY
ncbi:MAG TPA: hypothetical protein VN450_05565 [Candidatus Methylomirabilis sp.]|nr:hypothetical protein [Candidatus Methylomirabilis sp.]